MVIGNGMVAKKFAKYQDRDDVVIFASGVSNSKLAIESEFEREKALFDKTLAENQFKKLVYFSTFNLYDPKECASKYCLHKLNMEEHIAISVANYHIFRLGHIAGKFAKQYTILSYLYNAINEGNSFSLWKYASRNIIDIDDISQICSFIIDHDLFMNQITNVCNTTNTSILDIVQILEGILGKKAVFKIVEEGASPEVNNSNILDISRNLGIDFNDLYAKKVILKYYKNA